MSTKDDCFGGNRDVDGDGGNDGGGDPCDLVAIATLLSLGAPATCAIADADDNDVSNGASIVMIVLDEL